MAKQENKIISEEVIKRGILTENDIKQAIDDAQSSNESLSVFLSRNGLVQERQILDILSERLKVEKIDLRNTQINKRIVDRIPVKFVWYYKFMPVKIENKILTLAVSSPLDIKVQDEIRVNLGLEPKIVLATRSEIDDAIKKYYGLAAETIDKILTSGSLKTSLDDRKSMAVEDVEKQSEDASVIKLVNQIILEAYKKRATDIHVEPYRNKVRFRYRIDGVLVDANLPPEIRHFLLPILSRIKIMSNLSIVEKRLPQDGSAVVRTKDQTLDLRVSTIPTPNGESMVIRILPTKVMLYSLEKLGLDDSNVKIFRELIKKPHGVIFVTGPTGSGKTTTLYACLNEINSAERKIITIEDPVEYEMEGVTQIQVNPKVNLDFARGLRSVLRHDPDIIMVGEVRDLETAEIAVRTALTGHLVFSTLHTNDASSGITRLVDMGMEPFLVASSIEAFIAQRLVRVICPNCKEEVKSPMLEVKNEIQEALGISDADQIKIYEGKGCDRCNNTGFYGRTAIHEILVVNDKIRSAVLERPRADYIRQIAIGQGMTTLRQDGWKKAYEGITTPMEVMNVTSKEDVSSAKGEENQKSLAEDKKPETDTVVQSYKVLPQEMMSVKNEFDLRTYKRIKQKLKIKYKIFHPEQQDSRSLRITGDNLEHNTETIDISAGGLLFVAHVPNEVGVILEMKIQLGKDDFIDCLAKVSRVEEDEMTLMYRIAVYYLDISSADRARLSDFVNKQAEKE